MRFFLNLTLALVSIASFGAVGAAQTRDPQISIAGAGGDFSGRSATLSTASKNTTQKAQNGLRLYDLHIAKMLEVSNQYCQDRPKDYSLRWNYLAEGGKIFMGEYQISCQLAKDTFKKFGAQGSETLTIDYAGNEEATKVPVLNLTAKNASDFAKFVQTLKPSCIETSGKKICPGARLE
ncbi:MAG: hypothetical protein GC158_16685 [Cyanobacteria bacterium RI_101]|nr:hypothetical protein [Cyanobacteria bacterium RI_101]